MSFQNVILQPPARKPAVQYIPPNQRAGAMRRPDYGDRIEATLPRPAKKGVLVLSQDEARELGAALLEAAQERDEHLGLLS